MVYPRPTRAASVARVVDVDLAAFDASAPLDRRIAGLWSLRGVDAFTPAGDRTVAELLGELLNDSDLVIASEAHEALVGLTLRGGDVLRDLAVVADRRGHLSVPGKSIDALARTGVDGRIAPLAKISSLAPSTPAPVVQSPKVIAGNDLVIERAAHPKMPATVQRIRGDAALVGSMREAALQLPISRRQLRFKRDGERFTVADVYAEGRASIGGAALAGAVPLAHGTRIDVDGEGLLAPAHLTARLVPKLDRSGGVTVRFRDQGRRSERLAVGEALFLGPGVDDDVPASVIARLVATEKGAVLVSAAPLPASGTGASAFALVGVVGVRFEGDDVVIADVTAAR